MKIFDYDDLGVKRSWDYHNGTTPEDDGINPIIETNKKIEMGDLFIINNIAYCVSSMSGKGMEMQYAIVSKIKEQEVFILNEEPSERNYTNEITCPYCGYEDTESWAYLSGLCEGEVLEVDCADCGKTFNIFYETYIYWQANKI